MREEEGEGERGREREGERGRDQTIDLAVFIISGYSEQRTVMR